LNLLNAVPRHQLSILRTNDAGDRPFGASGHYPNVKSSPLDSVTFWIDLSGPPDRRLSWFWISPRIWSGLKGKRTGLKIGWKS